MKLLNEFKEFAVKGNMMEMAIGIIIGASFNSVIDVLVKQILLPPLSLLSNGLNIDSKKIILREADISSSGDIINEEVAINYGFFIESLKKVNNYSKKYLINTLHGKVDNWTLKEVVRGHTAFHLNQFGVYKT